MNKDTYFYLLYRTILYCRIVRSYVVDDDLVPRYQVYGLLAFASDVKLLSITQRNKIKQCVTQPHRGLVRTRVLPVDDKDPRVACSPTFRVHGLHVEEAAASCQVCRD